MKKKNKQFGKSSSVQNPPDPQSHPQTESQAPVRVTTSWAGPIPPPEVLSAYDDRFPGFGERLLVMAQEEVVHRRKMDEAVLKAQIGNAEARSTERKMGQVFALIIGVAALCLGTYAAVNGAQITGTFIGTSGVVGLVTAFLYKRGSTSQ